MHVSGPIQRYILHLIEDSTYESAVSRILRETSTRKGQTCYLCFSRPVQDVKVQLDTDGIDSTQFHFIDILSSHYQKPDTRKNCTFVENPQDLGSIQNSIREVCTSKGCSRIFIDTVSSLLNFHPRFKITQFINALRLSDEAQKKMMQQAILLSLSNEKRVSEQAQLNKDLSMFVEEVIKK